MARSAVISRRKPTQPVSGARWIPAVTVAGASALAILPILVVNGWWPSFGLLMLVAWRMHRADAWPAWWSAPLGFFNDLTSGLPIGFSVAIWPALMIAMDMVDRRTEWRGYAIEWLMAASLLAAVALLEWQVVAVQDAPARFLQVLPPYIIEVLLFPLALMLVTRIDQWRLGR